ncbi:MAG: trypsin-like peptidase domain-containing protein [Anaerolineales bacterium]
MDEESNSKPTSEKGRWSARVKTLGVFARRTRLFAHVIISVVLGLLLYNVLFPPPIPLSQNEVDESIEQAIASVTPRPSYSSLVYQFIQPSLVFIQTQRDVAEEDEGFGVGSGVVINEGGEILTALHVVDDATEIEIHFVDGSQASAEIIAAEPENDIAVLRPNPPPELIVPAILGNPGAMRVGDEAFAVGNPLGLVSSMSAGVISGFNRSFTIEESGLRLEGLIQFDTAVNPGNSGGPLLNRQGQVVGIVTALANPSEQNFFVGIGFAVPIGTAVSAAGGIEY